MGYYKEIIHLKGNEIIKETIKTKSFIGFRYDVVIKAESLEKEIIIYSESNINNVYIVGPNGIKRKLR